MQTDESVLEFSPGLARMEGSSLLTSLDRKLPHPRHCVLVEQRCTHYHGGPPERKVAS